MVMSVSLKIQKFMPVIFGIQIMLVWFVKVDIIHSKAIACLVKKYR